MSYETIVKKKLHLKFKGSDGKTKSLVIARADDRLKKDVANVAMNKIIDSKLFEKESVSLYVDRSSVYYKTCIKEVFKYDD